MRSNSKDGSYNETAILCALNNHYVKDLDIKWQRHIKRMFKNVIGDDYVIARYHIDKQAKPDIEIIINNTKKCLSIKSGSIPTMHTEPVKTFYNFLREYHVPERIIRIISFYHYGYSLKSKKYSDPLSKEEIIEKYPTYIKEVNNYFNNHQEIVREIIYRSVIRGRLKGELIDYFYYGNSAKGFLLSTSDINNLIINNKNEDCSSICFNALVYAPGARDINSNKHHKMKITWPILCLYFYDEEFMKKYG